MKADTFDEARDVVRSQRFDLIIVEAAFTASGQANGYEFLSWLRRSGIDPNAYSPAIITSAHTSLRAVVSARDCGANFVVAKPLIPAVLLDRIIWVARENRPFITADHYVGPDRRWHHEGPPPDTEGRRGTDLSAKVGEAVAPNMTQEEIDSLMLPKRVAL